MDARLIAVKVGDALKYVTSINEVNRIGAAVLKVNRDTFPNDAITSQRAKLIHDWVLSLAKASLTEEERERRLVTFCRELAGTTEWPNISKMLAGAGIAEAQVNRETYNQFINRGFHPEVIRHGQPLFMDGHLFHAVFEAAKVYNKAVREKAQSSKDGQSRAYALQPA